MCVCVCVCVCEREREGKRNYMYMYVFVEGRMFYFHETKFMKSKENTMKSRKLNLLIQID